MCSDEFKCDRLVIAQGSRPAHSPGTNGNPDSSRGAIHAEKAEKSFSQRRARTLLLSKEDSLRCFDEKNAKNSLGIRTCPLDASFRRKAESEARLITQERFKKSDLARKINEIPKFHSGEIILGKRLGRGGFSNVDEVRAIHIGKQPRKGTPIRGFPGRLTKLGRSDTVAINDKESRKFIAEHCYRRSGDARYAIKMLRKDTLQSEDLIILGLCDLAIETRFLANLSHPNIIKLRAISSSDPFSGEYFIILDRLYDTLAKRIGIWKASYRKLYSFWGRLRDRGGKKRVEFYESRIEKAFDLSAAIEHCHAYNIIHRDLKPDNIGFDVRGDVKVFDFGLARELSSDERLEGGTYNLTMRTGSLRFMAPEVWMGKPYNSACDVYSLGVILWAIIALKQPYSFCKWTDENHFAREILSPVGKRPDMGTRWPRALKDLFSQSWIHNQHERLSAKDMTKGLRDELVRLRHGDESFIPDHKRRRSTFIFEPTNHSEDEDLPESSYADFLDRSMKSQNSMHQSSLRSLGSDKDAGSQKS